MNKKKLLSLLSVFVLLLGFTGVAQAADQDHVYFEFRDYNTLVPQIQSTASAIYNAGEMTKSNLMAIKAFCNSMLKNQSSYSDTNYAHNFNGYKWHYNVIIKPEDQLHELLNHVKHHCKIDVNKTLAQDVITRLHNLTMQRHEQYRGFAERSPEPKN